MKILSLLAAGAMWMAAAENPAGFAHWNHSELKAFQQKLAPKMNQNKVAFDTIAKYGNHSVMAVHREGNGQVELHETQADIFVVSSGEATLVVGGTMVDPKRSGPNEMLGTAIKDGVRKRLGPGDVAHIPARTPHQVMVDAGKQFTYAIVKVEWK
jgi:mannose-6-phosphate isomerase-like protein (cupin superfamily)